MGMLVEYWRKGFRRLTSLLFKSSKWSAISLYFSLVFSNGAKMCCLAVSEIYVLELVPTTELCCGTAWGCSEWLLMF